MRAPFFSRFQVVCLSVAACIAASSGINAQSSWIRTTADRGIQHAFLGAWYLEFMAGNPEAAAELYEEVYGQLTRPGRWWFERERPKRERGDPRFSRDREVRLRAAYRAGVCLEALDRPREAALAYRWLKRQGRTGERLHEIALIKRMSHGLEDDVGELPGVSSVIEEIQALTKKRQDVESKLRKALEEKRRRSRWRTELIEQLRSCGLRLLLTGRPVSDADSVLGHAATEIESTLRSAFEGVESVGSEQSDANRGRLSERFYSRALRSALGGDLSRARWEAATSVALSAPTQASEEDVSSDTRPPDGTEHELRSLLDGSLPEDLAGTIARRRLAERHRLTVARVRQELRERLHEAQNLHRVESREFRALRALEEARRRVETAPLLAVADPEVQSLVKELECHYLRLFAGRAPLDTDSLRKLWNESGKQRRRTLDLAEKVIEAIVEEFSHAAPRFADSDGRSASLVAAAELRRLRREPAGSDQGAPEAETIAGKGSEGGTERLDFMVSTLKGWFPSLENE